MSSNRAKLSHILFWLSSSNKTFMCNESHDHKGWGHTWSKGVGSHMITWGGVIHGHKTHVYKAWGTCDHKAWGHMITRNVGHVITRHWVTSQRHGVMWSQVQSLARKLFYSSPSIRTLCYVNKPEGTTWCCHTSWAQTGAALQLVIFPWHQAGGGIQDILVVVVVVVGWEWRGWTYTTASIKEKQNKTCQSTNGTLATPHQKPFFGLNP